MFESFDPILLARIQFAANISFHILFPSITLALCWVLLYFKVRFHHDRQEHWMNAYRFWVKIFALSFALGVVSGITMSFQFGTNWPGFMESVGNIAGPLLAYEVLTAFFLEATFLGIMLFGLKRVGHKVHTLATFLVAIGTSLSAFWILVLNSWMQTPVGFEMIDGVAHATSWKDIIFNPSMPYRMSHMLVGSFLTVAFLLTGLAAYRWLKGDRQKEVKISLVTGLVMAAVLTPTQIFIGDLHGLNTLKHQPAKIAALEAIWETEKGAALTLFGVPNEKDKRTDYAVKIPKLGSLILTHDINGELPGLNEFKGEHPPVAPIFYSFRIMVGIGILMLFTAFIGCIYLIRKNAWPNWFLHILKWMSFSGWIGILAGWYTTEIGRQPWLVYGVLKTSEAASSVPSGKIGLTLFLYLILYGFLLFAYISVVFYLARKRIKPSNEGINDA